MSKNIDQVFIANPITSNAGTDLMYFGQSPYGAGNDAAMLYSNFSAQFGAPYTASALTIGNDTNVTLTLGGTPATALLHAASITAGWTGTLSSARGGTGVNNGTSTITIGGNVTYSGAFTFTGTLTNTTAVTFPTSGTLATTSQIPTLPLSLANGGTNANLTANNGGIFYSTASAGAILAGTATANQVLLSGSSTTPAWSTATYPATTTANQLLYSSATNTVGGLTSANGGVLVTSNSGVPSILAGSGTTNTILQATSGGTPAWSTATYPATTTINQILFSSAANVVGGISTANNSILQTNGSGVPSFATSLPSGTTFISTVDQNTSSVTLAVNTQYITDNGASLVTYTLPTTCAIGSIFKIRGKSSGGWKVAQSSGQQIQVGSSASTSGATGSIASSNQWDCVDLTCVTANNIFVANAVQGNLTIV